MFASGPGKLDEDIIIEPFDNYRSVESTYIDHGHDTINTSWYPLYLLDGILTTPQNLYAWNLYFFGNYKTFSPRNPNNITQYTVTKTDKVLGVQMSSWEAPQQAEVALFRRRLPAMIERAWLRTPRPTTYAEFAKRLNAADARLTTLLSTNKPAAVNATASNSVYADRIEVEWPSAQGYPQTYSVYRGTNESAADAKLIAADLTTTKWTDKTAKKSESYFYWVRPKNTFGENGTGQPSKGSVGTDSKIASVYEGFSPKDADASGTLGSAHGGIGWAGAWKINHADGANLKVISEGLTYPGLTTSGGALELEITDEKNGLEIQRHTAKPQVAAGATTWVSYLLKVNHAGDGHFLFMINNSGSVAIGKEWGRGLGIVGRPSTTAVEDGKTYLMVTQVNAMNGNDVVRTWINPALNVEPSADSPDVSFRDDIDAGNPSDLIRVQVQHHGRGSYVLDEIRFGGSFADVVPKTGSKMSADDSAPADSTAAADPVEKFKGKYISLQFKKSDFVKLKDRAGFIKFMYDAYLQMKELTTAAPVVDIRGGETPPGVWGFAGDDGIVVNWNAIGDVFKDFNEHRMSFGTIHEMGHRFDAHPHPRWYITPHAGGEEFANLKVFFAADRLLRTDNSMRIDFGPGGPQTGWDFSNKFLRTADKYLADSSLSWTDMQSDDLATFHVAIARKYGWDVLKK